MARDSILHSMLSDRLDGIREMFQDAAGMRLTLVVRHETDTDCTAVIGNDEDFAAIRRLLAWYERGEVDEGQFQIDSRTTTPAQEGDHE